MQVFDSGHLSSGTGLMVMHAANMAVSYTHLDVYKRQGPTHTNIIFDVLIPYKFQIQDDELAARITSQVRERLGNNYYVVIKVCLLYTSSIREKSSASSIGNNVSFI